MSLLFSPSTDLKYFSIVERSLGLGTLFVTIDIPLVHGRMNSVCIVDLIPFKKELI